jgi:7,8-dihydropterin-6-yl-methyl-4-(beta-D-ribofuranosyl)aminobenzene 5'-phosphate synthase
MSEKTIREADRIEICILVDNYSDMFLPDSDRVKRLRVLPPNGPLAEPGLSCLIKVNNDFNAHTVLFDGGISAKCLLHNGRSLAQSKAVVMGEIALNFRDIETVILSHGHFDHFGGLLGFFNEIGKKTPLYLHPKATVPRRYHINPQMQIDMPGLDEAALKKAGASFQHEQKAFLIASDLILVSGEVERVTDFEKGMPGMEAKIDGNWIPDPFYDDQGLAINLKNKGLVVLGGCSHAGIVNTVRHLKKKAGVDKVHAILGGFHLSGDNERIIDPTIEEVKSLNPDYVVPMHCTGWNAVTRFAKEMPEQFLLNSVGSTYIFE